VEKLRRIEVGGTAQTSKNVFTSGENNGASPVCTRISPQLPVPGLSPKYLFQILDVVEILLG
jgi:hypothetical protein